MGIWAESAKTLKYNNSLLKGNRMFSMMGDHPYYNRTPSALNPKNMNLGLNLYNKRRKSRTIVFTAFIFSSIIAAFLVYLLG